MTLIAVAFLLLFAVLLVAAVAAARGGRRRLPRPDAPSGRHDQLTRQLRLAHEQSAARTREMNRDLERLRTGARWREDQ